jgi:hypothetical protein
VSAKLTPEICINNASSKQQADNSGQASHNRRQPFTDMSSDSVFFSLPTFDEKTTELHLHAEKLTGTVLHLNLGLFVGFFFCVCSFVLLYASL